MCLSKPRTKGGPRFRIQRALNKQKDMIGYKIFTETDKGLRSRFYWKDEKSILPTGKWINEKDFRHAHHDIIMFEQHEYYSQHYYKAGFHCYLTENDAKRHCNDICDRVRKVYMKNILQLGFELHTEIAVAQYIKILGGK